MRPFHQTPTHPASVITTHHHNPTSFTQGLIVSESGTSFYESTGGYGQSKILETDITSGQILQSRNLEPSYFGEGLTFFRGKLIQLTWQEGTLFSYDRRLSVISEDQWPRDGWGLTTDGVQLISSDGSDTLYFGEGVNIRKLPIKSWKNGRLTPIANLNELEWVRGLIYANVWLSPLIAVIDPVTGIVVKWIDLSSLVRVEKTVDDMVANGIAFDKVRGKLYVTGKWWKRVYEIEL